MSATELRAMIEHCAKLAAETIAEGGEVPPTWYAFTAKGEAMISPPPCEDRDLACMLMRALFEIRNVVRYIFVDEAWIAEGKKELDDHVKRHGKISNFAGRQDAVIFCGEDIEAGQISAHCIVSTNTNGKRSLGPLQIIEFKSAEGRLLGLLPRRNQHGKPARAN